MCVWDDTTKKGLFIVFEGVDGAGKTTQAHLLVERLKKSGHDALYLKEPTNGQWGQKIRHIAMNGRDHVTPEEELQYFINDREEDSKQNIVPALQSGKVVVMDRYLFSNAAYQGALGFDPGLIFEKNKQFPQPDAVLYLDIEPEDGLKRVNTRGEANVGFEKIEYLHRVHAVFKGGHPGFSKMIFIDALQTREKIADAIWQKILPLLP
ncbi:MAG: dTMP kinase [Nitrospinae bacterium]|nr:dTMP kinase [Nitrospinota bacterium]